jgi:hypothetical protein
MESWNDSPGHAGLLESEDSTGEEQRAEASNPFGSPKPAERFWSFEQRPTGFDPFASSSSREIPRRKCLVVGPPGSGKTGFLLAVKQACQTPAGNGCQIRLQPLGRTASWVGRPAHVSADHPILPKLSDIIDPFEFRMEILECLNGRRSASPEASLEMIFHEAALSVDSEDDREGEDRHSRLEQGGPPDALLLLVDALNPRPEIWYEGLPLILDLLTGGGLKDLEMDRVLLLLSRIDLLCHEVSASRSATRSRLDDWLTRSSEGFAHAIDPPAQMVEMLGASALKAILDVLRPGASLAVGLASAGGFDAEGRTLLDAGGRPRIPDASLALRRWRPFGIREALLFLATGRAEPPISTFSYCDLSQASEALVEDLAETPCGRDLSRGENYHVST